MIALTALLLSPAISRAQWQTTHPGYSHAMADLREAYWLIEDLDVPNADMSQDTLRAGSAIRATYQTLKRAAIADVRDVASRPPKTMIFPEGPTRVREALDRLRDARRVVAREFDDPAAPSLRLRVLNEIDTALALTKTALRSSPSQFNR